MGMHSGLHYNIQLPEDISTIFEQDFWMLENIGPSILRTLSEPVKFAATSYIFITKGKCKAEINLVKYEIEAPSIVIVRSTQIMQPTYFSEDFNASVIVMSKRFSENMMMYFNASPLSSAMMRHSVAKIPAGSEHMVDDFFKSLREIQQDTENPYGTQALLYQVLLFLYKEGYKCYQPFIGEVLSKQGRMSDQFLALVQENFRKERFLDFYANKLEITPKHLSRTIKKQTGQTAVEWIERYVILEAKVLLKSSNLNIQQIADELNFPSQSFFGKYFKKLTGQSPKEFRNS